MVAIIFITVEFPENNIWKPNARRQTGVEEVRSGYDEPADALAVCGADNLFDHIARAFAAYSGDDGRALERGFCGLRQESPAADSDASI